MMMNKASTGIRGTTPRPPFEPAEKDAAAWANLLDDWLGPENDVYSRLLRRPGAETRKAGLAS
jgi:hypothetical protein